MKMQGETIKIIENYNYTAFILAKWYIRRKKVYGNYIVRK